MEGIMTEIERYAIVAGVNQEDVPLLATLPPHVPLLMEVIAALRSEVACTSTKPP